MYESIVIGPTADAFEPRLEQLELAVAKLAIESLQQEHGDEFLFQDRPRKKLVRNLHQKVQSELLSDFPTRVSRCPAQISRIPPMRFDFIFEKPLHAGGVLGGAAVFQLTANLRGNCSRRARLPPHDLSTVSARTSLS